MIIRRIAIWLLMLLLVVSAGCGSEQKKMPAAQLPDVRIAVVGAVVPMGTTDLLAGFIPEHREVPSQKALMEFDEDLMRTLSSETRRKYDFISPGLGADPTVKRFPKQNGALAYWTEIGKKNGMDVLILPQILHWKERQGSAAGVREAAAINISTYLIDVRGKGVLLSRSVYNEQQMGLSSNLLQFDSFVKRGGRWVTARELSGEAMKKLIEDFGL